MKEIEQRRERARIAQRRSRAQRRRDHDGLQARVQSLETALEDLIKSCLSFTDAVIPAIQQENVSTLRQSIKPFVNHALAISRDVLYEGNDDKLVQTPPTSSGSAETTTARAQSQVQLRRAQLSPRLTYGLLPSNNQINQAPLDILKYLSPGRYRGFAKALFWNTLLFGNAVLAQPASPLAKQNFFYPLRVCSLDKVRNHVLRRIQFKPSDIKIVVPTVEINSNDRATGAGFALEDVEIEARRVQKDHQRIVESMHQVRDDLNAYLEAEGVEQYLAARWGMNFQLSPIHGESSTGSNLSNRDWNVPNAERLISYLASRSRCLGNRVGFPIVAVDEAVTGILDVNIR